MMTGCRLVTLMATKRGVYLDPQDVARYGELYAYIDEYGRVVVSLNPTTTAFLHRLILDTSKQVDHINGNPTDNRRCNLREATPSQNCCNKGKQSNNASGYKGVYFHKAAKQYSAELTFNRKKYYLGLFATAELAALAYNKAAILHHKEFAQLNEVTPCL